MDADALAAELAQAPDLEGACHLAVTALARDGGLAAAAYVGRVGRLRCLASAGAAHVLDGVPAASGLQGRAAASGQEQREPADAPPRAVAIPLVAGDGAVPVGAVLVEGAAALSAARIDEARTVAAALAARIAELGGPPAEGAASRLAQHAAALAGMEDPARIERATLVAALDLAGMESAALFRADDDGSWSAAATAGALGARLATLGIVPLDGLAMLVAGGASCTLGPADPPDASLPLGLGALREAGARTAIVTPLLVRGRTLGLLVLADERALEPSTSRAELVELIAVQAASNLRTAAAVAELRHRATTDPLTGLGHRGAFAEALGASHRRPIATAVALCDLDRFKELNDRYGHQEGDRALVTAVRALEEALRRGDLLFRLGGDEFAALLAVRDEQEALAAAHRMRAAVADSDAGLTVSVGVAVSGPEEADDALVGRADRALYAAKRDGRDGVALDAGPQAPASSATAS